jgi:hypothetical protein
MYVPHPESIKYIGKPSPEIDENWEKLTWGTFRLSGLIQLLIFPGRYFLITEEEARGAWGDDIEEYWDEKLGGYCRVSFANQGTSLSDN